MPGPTISPAYYRTAHNDLFQGAAVAKFVFDQLGLTKAAAIHDGDPYTDGLATAFANSFRKLGGEIVVYTAVNKDDTDMTGALTEVAQGAPEAIFFPIFQPAGDFIIQQVGGISGLEGVTLIGADGLLVTKLPGDPGDRWDVLLRSGYPVRGERQRDRRDR